MLRFRRTTLPRLASLIGLVIATVIVSASILLAQSAQPVTESDVKAAYVYQFRNYVEWPAGVGAPGSALIICVLNDAAMTSSLGKLGKDGTDGPSVAIRSVSSTSDMADCQILFLGSADAQYPAAVLKDLGNQPTLTVGDHTQFSRRGGMIAFLVRDHKVRFEINVSTTDAAHLRVSSQLLRHASAVFR